MSTSSPTCEGNVLIGGIMEHIEEAGVHSGDSSCSLPPYTLSAEIQDRLRVQVTQMARELKVIGLMNTQFAIQGETIFVLEVNPRASRTVPFVSKAIGVPLAKIAARCMVGQSLAQQGATREIVPGYYLGQGSDLPVREIPGRRSDPRTGDAFDRRSDGRRPHLRGRVRPGRGGREHQGASASARPSCRCATRTSRACCDVARIADRARVLSLVATTGTSAYLGEHGIACEQINKVIEGRPHIVDLIKNGEIVYIVNTTEGKAAIADSFSIRREALQHRVTYSTTIPGARALIQSIDSRNHPRVWSLQELHKESARMIAPLTTTGARRLRDELEHLKSREAARGHPRHRRGARARRSEGERRIPRGARAAGLHRRPHPANSSTRCRMRS